MFKKTLSLAILLGISTSSLANDQTSHPVPADKFDMMNWKITVPEDRDKNGKIDEIEGVAMFSYSNPDYFFLDKDGNMVFQVQNKAITTSGSSNARSELRQMLRGTDLTIDVKAPANNFAISAHPNADQYGAVGGKLEATLKVNHVATHANQPNKLPAYSVVVGQIHANKDPKLIDAKTGFGYGNEPLKIFYKKWPGHNTGSVFWNYERNLEKNDPNRIDIAYPVWGNTWENKADPKDAGLALGEEFSYTIDVQGNIMHLTFTTVKHATVEYKIDLSKNLDAHGKVDAKDNPRGYAEDSFYFKAGAYGQCSVKDDDGFWSPGCAGTGDFAEDMKNGDYNSVSFSKLVLSGSKAK
ncbi:polysaccharide lyase family 7 protein [Vibrio algivorus]|uniref:Polysaccharide lyase family 7 protein n=1 Tax=Vibrio algivorus TaxID=1667024 RepID=A0A557PBZ5_9VIBR|nr:polysaccharide lyase family 7 protein [Vibrio algivorus]TVO38185.1 polysaccharide lyase family 7 protein [Vibrio algivorus]